MYTDISITSIANAYYNKSSSWKRATFAVRSLEAVVFFTEGEIEYHFQDKTLIAKKGDLLFLPGNVPYSGKKHTEVVAYYVINFRCVSENEFNQLVAPAVITPKNYDIVCSKFSKAIQKWNMQQTDVNLQIKSYVYAILCEAFRNNSTNKSTVQNDELLACIAENIGDSTLNVKQLCDKLCISESQLRRNLIKETGMRPNEYILLLRLNKAKNELIYTNKTVKEISSECGFSSPYYFSLCFSKKMNLSPTEFRNRYNNG